MELTLGQKRVYRLRCIYDARPVVQRRSRQKMLSYSSKQTRWRRIVVAWMQVVVRLDCRGPESEKEKQRKENVD